MIEFPDWASSWLLNIISRDETWTQTYAREVKLLQVVKKNTCTHEGVRGIFNFGTRAAHFPNSKVFHLKFYELLCSVSLFLKKKFKKFSQKERDERNFSELNDFWNSQNKEFQVLIYLESLYKNKANIFTQKFPKTTENFKKFYNKWMSFKISSTWFQFPELKSYAFSRNLAKTSSELKFSKILSKVQQYISCHLQNILTKSSSSRTSYTSTNKISFHNISELSSFILIRATQYHPKWSHITHLRLSGCNLA